MRESCIEARYCRCGARVGSRNDRDAGVLLSWTCPPTAVGWTCTRRWPSVVGGCTYGVATCWATRMTSVPRSAVGGCARHDRETHEGNCDSARSFAKVAHKVRKHKVAKSTSSHSTGTASTALVVSDSILIDVSGFECASTAHLPRLERIIPNS